MMVICVKVFGFFLVFIKLSSYSNFITHMFVISLHVVHFITPFFLSNQVLYLFKSYRLGKIENFIQSDCFCRYTTVSVVPSLSIDNNLVIEISGVVCKKNYSKVPNNRWGSDKQGGVRNLSKI